ncbi:MAG: heme exporter protein CcmB [Thermoleophilia bacterium]
MSTTANRPRWTRQLAGLIRKDLRLELRTKETVMAMVLFAIVTLTIMQFGFGTRDNDLTRFTGGLMWVTLAFTAVLGVGRSYVAEREQRVLDGILVSPVPRIVLLAAKAIAIVIYMGITELVVIPLVGIFFVKGPYWDSIGWIALVALIANVCIALSGTLFSGLALFTRARDLILPVLFLPALVPVVIAGAGATHAVVGGAHDMSEYRGYCLFLVGYAILFLLVCIATYDAVFDD